MSKGENLANVAASLNHEGFVGMMCHDSVAECLIKAAVLPHNGVLWLRQQFAADPRKLWTQIYANKQDQRVTRQSIHAYGYGLIVGFYPPGIDLIYHSMIAVGGGVLAGSNNLGVGGQLNYHMISVDDLSWDAAGVAIGPNDYSMHVIDVDQVVSRYQQAARRHKLHKLGGNNLTLR